MEVTMPKFQRQAVRVYDDVGTGHKVDVYTPPVGLFSSDKNQTHPVIFYLHGGAWHIGNKKNAQTPCMALAEKGYVTVAASYSLSSLSHPQMEVVFGVVIILMLTMALMCVSVTQMMLVFLLLVIVISFFLILWMFVPHERVQHPDHILDVAHAFRWTVDHIHEYGGDPNRIYVMGHSAGGHLAALLSTNFHYLDVVGVKPSRVKGCIAVSGVYSDQRMKESSLGQQLLINAFGLREHYYDAFPVYNVTDNTPPFLLLNAGMDFSLKRHTFDMHYVLRASGVYVETEYFEQKSHWNIMDDWGQKHNPVCQKILAFLKSAEEYHMWLQTEKKGEDKKTR